MCMQYPGVLLSKDGLAEFPSGRLHGSTTWQFSSRQPFRAIRIGALSLVHPALRAASVRARSMYPGLLFLARTTR